MRTYTENQAILFDDRDESAPDLEMQQYLSPRGHSGLQAFHKYWGKKPSDVLRFLVRNLSSEGDVIMDPFLGYGSLAYECALVNRRFIGSDINPISTAIARFMLFPPNHAMLKSAINDIESECRAQIDNTYRTSENEIASHVLWENTDIQAVWVTKPGRKRIELEPTAFDLMLSHNYQDYVFNYCRPIQLFDNSRINTTENLVWADIFTGRAMHNIDTLIHSISKYPDDIREPLMLILSSSVGQMSKMVFAIKRRGTRGKHEARPRVEVGSWVVGYWRPSVHFEVNVWNCFARRCQKALTAIRGANRLPPSTCLGIPQDVVDERASVSLSCVDAAHQASELMPEGSVDLVLTDPPHGDWIPYLELSEMWNALLGFDVNWDREIIISNARGRQKDANDYASSMGDMSELYGRVLRKSGMLGLIFNTRNHELWRSVFDGLENANFQLLGTVPLRYSATSVIQDNRRGALTEDRLLLYSRGKPGCGPCIGE